MFYKNINSSNFRWLLFFSKLIALSGYLSFGVVLIVIIIQTVREGMATQVGIVAALVTPIILISISGILAILISMEENSRITKERFVSEQKT
ncbi:hypothetical protein L0668_01710 [Paraglaciecola aquimarina]|uniref:Uncharacterized protein n=1 Tax=Paraglaciecola algarum TaxID=3050085 RepID=A0ABS9D461_9ALTE|nr:hypothetical protein [Paraglaciecola sp. G1-23]MCF2946807.1 hypothetical protein [Paraglaciecola sp. G1-23]